MDAGALEIIVDGDERAVFVVGVGLAGVFEFDCVTTNFRFRRLKSAFADRQPFRKRIRILSRRRADLLRPEPLVVVVVVASTKRRLNYSYLSITIGEEEWGREN